MIRRQRRRSLTFPLILTVLIVAGLVGGYYVWQRDQNQLALENSTTKLNYASPAVTTPKAPAITTTAQLSQALNAVNNLDVTGSNIDNAQLGVQAAGF